MSTTPPAPLTVEERMEIGAKLAFGADPIMNFTPYLLGMWIDAILLGLLFGLFVEWKRFVWPSEKRITKFLMCYLLFISFVISCHVLLSQMYLFVANFGTYRAFLNYQWHRYTWIFNTLSRVPAGTFFTYRAWLLMNKSIIIPLTAAPLLLCTVACSFGAAATAEGIPIKDDALERLFVIIFVTTELATDVINTCAIAYGLYRSRTGWKSTDRLIVRLFVLLAETQLPPTLGGLGFLICWVGFPNSRWIYIFAGVAKIHCLCLLVCLTARVRMKVDNEETQQSYPMNISNHGTAENYIRSQDGHKDDKFTPTRSQIEASGTMHTINGRPLAQRRHDSYRGLNSDTSLVVTEEA